MKKTNYVSKPCNNCKYLGTNNCPFHEDLGISENDKFIYPRDKKVSSTVA